MILMRKLRKSDWMITVSGWIQNMQCLCQNYLFETQLEDIFEYMEKITAMSDAHYITLLPKRQRNHVTRSLSFLINLHLLNKQRKQLSNLICSLYERQ